MKHLIEEGETETETELSNFNGYPWTQPWNLQAMRWKWGQVDYLLDDTASHVENLIYCIISANAMVKWPKSIFLQLISGGIAVATYNEGATDFKKTPVYTESLQSQELLEQPDASNTDVFEANPTETAPSLQ